MIQYTKIQAFERSQPNLQSTILKTLPIGTELNVTYIGNGWARINKPIPLMPTYIATTSLQDENPLQPTQNWFGFVDTGNQTPTQQTVNWSTYTQPATVPTTTTPARPTTTTPAKPKTTPGTVPATMPTEPPKNNTIWYLLGGATLISLYLYFKKKRK